MMKKLQLLFMAILISTGVGISQTSEVGPFSDVPANNNRALFDLISIYDVGANGATGVNGLAAVLYFEDEYYVALWSAAVGTDIFRLDSDGNLLDIFQIAGVEGTRSFTTDGTNIYIGTAGSTIYVVDPATWTLSGTISVSSVAVARMVTYDETLDGGNGGFWIGSFSNDIASIDMDGNELSTIPAGVHGTAIYGGAIDNVSPGGPFLWIHDQSGTVPARDFVTQIEVSSGLPTGVVYDFSADGFNNGANEVLAGGIFIHNQLDDHDGYVITGLSQSDPSNLVFNIELTEELGVSENALSNVSLYPNPASGTVNVETGYPGTKQISVVDVLGKTVLSTSLETAALDISSLGSGVYMVKVVQNGSSVTKKLVVR